AGARVSEAVRDGGRSGLHKMHGLRERLSERRALFRFRKTNAVRAQIERDQNELFADVASRYRWRTGIHGKFPGCSWRLRIGSVPDGARLRCSHNVPRFEVVAIASGAGIVLLPFQFEVVRKDSKGRLGVCSFRLCLDWIERAQWLGALPRISWEPRVQ